MIHTDYDKDLDSANTLYHHVNIMVNCNLACYTKTKFTRFTIIHVTARGFSGRFHSIIYTLQMVNNIFDNKPRQGDLKKTHGRWTIFAKHRDICMSNIGTRLQLMRTSRNDMRRGNMGSHQPSNEQARSYTNTDGKKYVTHHNRDGKTNIIL